MVSGVSGLNSGYYSNYFNNSSNIENTLFLPFGSGSSGINFTEMAKKANKVSFWEGVKAFGKGLTKPITNMIKHPIKSLLFMGATAAILIGTGGAALPLLIGAGVAIGGYQVAKGAYKACTAKTKAEKLAGLESMGEGTFTLGASAFGAKSYAAGTKAGSATSLAAKETTMSAKAIAYIKGLGSDTLTTLKAVPGSAKTTVAMVQSGEFTGNVSAFAHSAKFAIQRAKLDRMRLAKDPNYKAAKRAYKDSYKEYVDGLDKRTTRVFENYSKMYDKGKLPAVEKAALDFAGRDGFKLTNSAKVLLSKINPVNNIPEENLAIGIASPFDFGSNEVAMQNALYTYGPAFGLTA